MFKIQARFRRSMMLVALLGVVLLSPGAAQSKFPVGKYANGDLTINFSEDGTHTVSLNDKVVVKGSYAVTQDQIAITDKEGEYSCASTGKYKWKVDGTSLKFEKVEDECDGRVSAIAGAAWEKK